MMPLSSQPLENFFPLFRGAFSWHMVPSFLLLEIYTLHARTCTILLIILLPCNDWTSWTSPFLLFILGETMSIAESVLGHDNTTCPAIMAIFMACIQPWRHCHHSLRKTFFHCFVVHSAGPLSYSWKFTLCMLVPCNCWTSPTLHLSFRAIFSYHFPLFLGVYSAMTTPWCHDATLWPSHVQKNWCVLSCSLAVCDITGRIEGNIINCSKCTRY